MSIPDIFGGSVSQEPVVVFVPTLESHTHVYCGESLSRLPHTMQHQAADWIEGKMQEYTSVKHTLVILMLYFYWPPKNEMATWANKHEF